MRRGQNRSSLIILKFFVLFSRAKVVDSHPPPVVEEKPAVVESMSQWI